MRTLNTPKESERASLSRRGQVMVLVPTGSGSAKQKAQRSSGALGIRQSDITRMVRGAIQAGIEVGEVIATRDAIHILTREAAARPLRNSWDDVLDNG
jgi:hypothetical protein